MRQKFNSRTRAPGEKLGVFTAELCYQAQKGFPEFDETTRLVFAKEAFIHGLLPVSLSQQTRAIQPLGTLPPTTEVQRPPHATPPDNMPQQIFYNQKGNMRRLCPVPDSSLPLAGNGSSSV
ncbi:hypothetical protein AAFF_G00307860 [Aldrovandia affinis]|uniref:Uncharacterized protein n=1 Tax=Aldrovandia affinis TaxID=143900 RepID=A0AAD7W0M5_9TELE|nr:hypothetical protein AAFF_G00307860 [Aldrovandia affinis]